MEKVPYQPDPDDFTKIYISECLRIPRHIVCAANLFNHNGKEIIVTGVRHWDPIMSAAVDAIGIDDKKDHEQGFVDQYGIFVTREDAATIATKNEQTMRDSRFIGGVAYSENFY